MTQQFQYDVDKLVTDIRVALDRDDEPGARIAPLAERYAEVCELTNELLGECVQLLDQGLKLEAVEFSRQFDPELETIYNKLQIPDTDGARIMDWWNLVEASGLPRPPRLFEKGYAALCHAKQETAAAEPLLARHRLLALHSRRSFRERLQVLRQLIQLDPNQAGWEQDLRAFEEQRHLQMRDELQRAAESGDDHAIQLLINEVLEPETPWSTEVAPTLVDQLRAHQARIERQDKQARNAALNKRLTALLGKMRTALEAGDIPAILGVWNDWEQVGEKYLKQLTGDSLKLVERTRREVTRHRDEQAALVAWKKQCDQLRKLVSSGDADKHPAAMALAEGLRLGRGLPPELESAVSEWGLRLLENERIQRNTTLLAVCVVAVLLFGGGGFAIWLTSSRAAAAKTLMEFQTLVADETPEGIRQAEQFRQGLSASLLSQGDFRAAAAQLENRVEQLNAVEELEAALQDAERSAAIEVETLRTQLRNATAMVTLEPLKPRLTVAETGIEALADRRSQEAMFEELMAAARTALDAASAGDGEALETAAERVRRAAATEAQREQVAALTADVQAAQLRMSSEAKRVRWTGRLTSLETETAKVLAAGEMYDWRELSADQGPAHEKLLKTAETTLATAKSLRTELESPGAAEVEESRTIAGQVAPLLRSLTMEVERLTALTPCVTALVELQRVIRKGLDEAELTRYEQKLTALRDAVRRLPIKDPSTTVLLKELDGTLAEFPETRRVVQASLVWLRWIEWTDSPREARRRLAELGGIPEAEWSAAQRDQVLSYLTTIAARDAAEPPANGVTTTPTHLERLLTWLTAPQTQRAGVTEKPPFTSLWSVTLYQDGARTYYGDVAEARTLLKSPRLGSVDVERWPGGMISVPKTGEFKADSEVAVLARLVEAESRRLREQDCANWEETWGHLLDRVLSETKPGHEIFRGALAWQVFSTAWEGSPLWREVLGPPMDWPKELGFKAHFPFWNPDFPESPEGPLKKSQELLERIRQRRPPVETLTELREVLRTNLAKTLPLLDVPVGEIWRDRQQARVLLTPPLLNVSEPLPLRVLAPGRTPDRWCVVATMEGGKPSERFEDAEAQVTGRVVFARVRAANLRP
jgi:hypothetical protein